MLASRPGSAPAWIAQTYRSLFYAVHPYDVAGMRFRCMSMHPATDGLGGTVVPGRTGRLAGRTGRDTGSGAPSPTGDQTRANDAPSRQGNSSPPIRTDSTPVRMAGSEVRSVRNRSIKGFWPHPGDPIDDASMWAEENST